jgi:hypothetical protein
VLLDARLSATSSPFDHTDVPAASLRALPREGTKVTATLVTTKGQLVAIDIDAS